MIHLRIFLPVFFLLYFLLTFLMYAPKRKDKPPKLKTVTLLNNLIWLLVIALTTIFSLFPEIYHQYVVPFEALKTHTLSWVAIGIFSFPSFYFLSLLYLLSNLLLSGYFRFGILFKVKVVSFSCVRVKS